MLEYYKMATEQKQNKGPSVSVIIGGVSVVLVLGGIAVIAIIKKNNIK